MQMRRCVARYPADQLALAERYRVRDQEPRVYDDVVRAQIERAAAACREPYELVMTSGTMAQPKQLLYPLSRARVLQRTYMKQVLLACDHAGVDRLAGYFVTNLAPDRSLSALLARVRPPRLLRSIALRESLGHVPEAAALAARFSSPAVHVALLALASPSILTAVNPSSLSGLFDRVGRDWLDLREALRALLRTDLVDVVRARLGSVVQARHRRLLDLIDASSAPAIRDLVPDLRIVCCWDGGYVQPFLDRLREQLRNVAHFYPMFSLSTETVAYEIYPRLSLDGGLPIYPGVCYEFLDPNGPAAAAHLCKPWDIDVGRLYEMVVSDAFGLTRYRTGDVFVVLGVQGRVPLLRFMGRAGLSYSFTGEKITAEQLLAVYERVHREHDARGVAFTCLPSAPQAPRGAIPGYVFVACFEADGALPVSVSAEALDRMLSEMNHEYAAKRASGRLATPRLVVDRYDRLRAAIIRSDGRFSASNPEQFKLLPLYQMLWEALDSGP
jgi:hypothetical protein